MGTQCTPAQKHTGGYLRDCRIWHKTVPRNTGLKKDLCLWQESEETQPSSPSPTMRREGKQLFQLQMEQGLTENVLYFWHIDPHSVPIIAISPALNPQKPQRAVEAFGIKSPSASQALIPTQCYFCYLVFLAYKKVSLHSVKDRRIFWNGQSMTSCVALNKLSKKHSAGYQRAPWA